LGGAIRGLLVAISPDGTRIAHTMSSYTCSIATDLGDGELTRQGTRLALVRDYGPDATVWYDVTGNALSGLPAAPAMRCLTSADEGINGPAPIPTGARRR
jgi:hypothetical protein